MTYSRPNVGPIDTGGRIRNPQDQRGAAGVDVRNINFGSFIDSTERDVRRQAEKARMDNARIEQLLSSTRDLVTGTLGAISKTADQNEWTSVFDNPALADKLVSGDPEAGKLIATLRPSNRKMAGRIQAESAATRYGVIAGQLAAMTPGIIAPKDGESQADHQRELPSRMAQIRENARGASGLSNVSPEYLADTQAIDKVVAADGATFGLVMKAQGDRQYSNLVTDFTDGARLTFSGALESYLQGVKTAPKDLAGRQRWKSDQMGRLSSAMDEIYRQGTNLNLRNLEINKVIGSAIKAYTAELLNPNANLSASEALARITAVTELLSDTAGIYKGESKLTRGAQGTAETPAVNIGQIVVGENGSTLLQEMIPILQEAKNRAKQDREDPTMNLYNSFSTAVINGENPEALTSIINQAIKGANDGIYDPRIVGQMIRDYASSKAGAANPMQQRTSLDLADTLSKLPHDERVRLLESASRMGLAPGQLADLQQRYGSKTAEERLDERNTSPSLALRLTSGSDSVVAPSRASFLEQVQSRRALTSDQMRELSARISKATFDELRGWIDSYKKSKGAMPTEKEMQDRALQIEESVQEREAKSLNVKRSQQQTYNDSMLDLFNDFLDNVRSGQRDVKRFSPPLLDEYRRSNPGARMDYRSVERWLINSASRVKGTKDGNDNVTVWPEPANAIREAAEEFRKKQQRPSGGLPGIPGIPGIPAINMIPGIAPVIPLLRGIDTMMTRPAAGAEAAPKTTSPEKSKSDPLANAASSAVMIMAGIAPEIVKAIPNPASAIVNPQTMSTLSNILRGQKLRSDTPPLPQAAYNAPSQIPSRITPDHPYFVMIGVNEGTRTPDGGKTANWRSHRDPANGKINIGTISYQGGGLSPAAADKLYAGQFQAEYMRLTPVLERLGVSRGTIGFDRLMFNCLDLMIQAPRAYSGKGSFLEKLPEIVRQGVTTEAIAVARAKSFRNPRTGKLEASALFGSSPQQRYDGLLRNQRKRAMTFDYRRKVD